MNGLKLQPYPAGPVNSPPFALDGALGAAVGLNVTVPNGGSVVAKLQQQMPWGVWVDVPGATTLSVSTVGGGVFKIYPGITAVANQMINSVLGSGVYRVVGTVTGGPVTFGVNVDEIR
jgi:hypothetical protein